MQYSPVQIVFAVAGRMPHSIGRGESESERKYQPVVIIYLHESYNKVMQDVSNLVCHLKKLSDMCSMSTFKTPVLMHQ